MFSFRLTIRSWKYRNWLATDGAICDTNLRFESAAFPPVSSMPCLVIWPSARALWTIIDAFTQRSCFGSPDSTGSSFTQSWRKLLIWPGASILPLFDDFHRDVIGVQVLNVVQEIMDDLLLIVMRQVLFSNLVNCFFDYFSVMR